MCFQLLEADRRMSNVNLLDKKSKGLWVQTERKAHEAWAALIRKSPMAAQIMHVLTANVGDHNAVVISQKNLARLVRGSERGVRDAIRLLCADNWLEVAQIGGRGTVNAYILNDRVVWTEARDKLKYSLFSATVVVSEDEQPDQAQLRKKEALRPIPRVMTGERQLPAGDGLPPPSEPPFPGFEPELPAITEPERGGEPKAFGDLIQRLKIPKPNDEV